MIAGNDRVLISGMLSRTTSFRITVRGPIGLAEYTRLIQKLQFDKDILLAEELASQQAACKGE
jgi:hypothetical protein